MSEIGRTRWGLVLALWVAGLGAAAQYGKISVVFDRMELLYPSAGAAIGFSVSMVGVVGLVLGVVAGVVVASLGYRRTIIVSLWLGAAMSLIQALHPPFALFLASRVVEGLSHLGLVVAVPTVIAQISLEKDRGTTLTLWSTFFGVAFALLVWFGLPVVERFGVPALFAVHCAIMAGLALALQGAMRSVPVPARQPFPRIGELAELHLGIYRSPWISAPAAGWVFYTMCFVSILTVLPAHIDPSVRAFVMGAMPLASIATSLTLGVWLMRVIPAVRVVILGFVLSAISMIWLWAAPGAPEACLGLACCIGPCTRGKLCRCCPAQHHCRRQGPRQWRHGAGREFWQYDRHPGHGGDTWHRRLSRDDLRHTSIVPNRGLGTCRARIEAACS